MDRFKNKKLHKNNYNHHKESPNAIGESHISRWRLESGFYNYDTKSAYISKSVIS